MSNNKIKTIIICAILGLCFVGFITSGKEVIKKTAIFDKNEISELIKVLFEKTPPGTEVTLEIENNDVPETIYKKGQDINVKSSKDYGRFFSWFGLGATEAAVKDQGFTIDGSKINFGQNKGYGFLEQLWNKLKSFFWSFSFIGLGLVVLMLIPATAPIAGMIFRGIAAVIPILGSFVERIIAGIKWKKPLNQTISGGQEFKRNINTHKTLTIIQKADVIEIFRSSMMAKQDYDTQKTINKIKAENGI